MLLVIETLEEELKNAEMDGEEEYENELKKAIKILKEAK